MKIPADAIIVSDKLTKYLLVPRAKGDKSRYLARAGFDQTNAGALETAIRHATASQDASVQRVTQHGTFYNVRCKLSGPSGIGLGVVLVWLYRIDGVYSFVTLIPDPEREP